MKNILFVCSKNKWRSLTAETIFKNHESIKVKSAGTENTARVKINAKHIEWSEVIFVMENMHKKKLFQNFSNELIDKEIIVLNIEDNYQYKDPELIEELETMLNNYLELA